MTAFRLWKSDDCGLDVRLTVFFGILGLIVGIVSIPATFWEWDEILFARGLQAYDVALHSPHPPGFPLYVFAASGVKLLGVDDKTALCLIGLVFAFILGAAAFAAFREILEDRRTAAAAAALLLFIPPVMLYAGTPRSDVPGMAAGLLVLALALKGRTSTRALAAAGLALGLGIGVRVTILAAAAPALIGVSLVYLKRRRWKPVLVSAGLAFAGVVMCYLPAIALTGLSRYRGALKSHALYTSSTDTFFSTNLNRQVPYRLGRFFGDVWGEPRAAIFILFLAALGLAVLLIRRRGRSVGLLALAFLPILVFTFFYMTPLAAPLYALPYLPMFAALVAAALVPPRRPNAPSGRFARLRPVGWILAGVLLVLSASWMAPVLKMRRKQESPTWNAVQYILRTRDPRKMDLYYDRVFLPFIRFNFGAYNCVPFQKIIPRSFNLLNPAAESRAAFAISPHPMDGLEGEHFSWSDPKAAERLVRLSLGRYSDVYVADLETRQKVVRGTGWSVEERDGEETWRWMGRRSETELLAMSGAMTLRLKAAVNDDALKPGDAATVVLEIDGREIDRIKTAGGLFERIVTVQTPPPSPWKRLTITCDRAIVPAALNLNKDKRELGLQVFRLDWDAAPAAEPVVYRFGSFIGEGWYQPERDGRWTRGEAYLKLPAIGVAGRLDLQMEVPLGPDRKRARVTLEINGRPLDAFDPPAGVFYQSYVVSPDVHDGGETHLRISVSRTVTAPFGRHLGVRLYSVSWLPIEPGREKYLP
ncbi:MAG: glycosyltransferase family 39 protein [Candidatus Aminicenantales bacterium]